MLLTASLCNISLTWVDGVKGEMVESKVLPPPSSVEKLGTGNVGSWRAHMNAMQTVVAQGLTSALIFEDDIDWDIRLKAQLYDTAKVFRMLTRAVVADTHFEANETDIPAKNIPGEPIDLNFHELPVESTPPDSPYGDNWDILWLGYCHGPWSPAPGGQPKDQVIQFADATVPTRYGLGTYPPQTRVWKHASDPICSLGYAVSQRGARNLLYEAGLVSFDKPFDILLLDFCQRYNCLLTQPQLFNHWRKPGKISCDSDISPAGDGPEPQQDWTPTIRQSARLNMKKLLEGDTNYDDQLPD
ncbi:hypothetical protein MMC32_005771 [Xylographa parallela]|nr:hypothetical protein [Xylographa parallela]